MSQIEKIKHRIDSTQRRIDEMQARLQRDGDNFALSVEVESTESHLNDLRAQLRHENIKREKEVIQLRFKGTPAHFGNLPLDSVGGLSSSFAKAIMQTSKYVQYGNKGGKKIETVIRETIDLRLEDIGHGSTIFYISAKTSPNLFGESIIQTALNNTFELLNSENPNQMSETILRVGSNSIKYFSDFFKELVDGDLEIEIGWKTPENMEKYWNGDKDRILTMIDSLNQIATSEPEIIDFVGTLITISSKGNFEVYTEDREFIKGKFSNELLPQMKSFHIGDTCSGTITKIHVFNPLTEKDKSVYDLQRIVMVNREDGNQ